LPSNVTIDPEAMLPVPNTSIHRDTGVGRTGLCTFGVASMQGWRLRMEDAHLALPDFDVRRQLSLFGVFDGHGGAAVAQVVSERLPGVLRKQEAYRAGRYAEALRSTFLELDKLLDSPEVRKEIVQRMTDSPPSSAEEEEESDEEEGADEEGEEEMMDSDDEGEEEELDADDEDLAAVGGPIANGESFMNSYSKWVNGEGPDCMGTTAVVALVRSGPNAEIFVANAGDSRCILATESRVAALSHDHKPTLKVERARIRAAGGFVSNEGRVDGNLNLSRALGDFAYKNNDKLPKTKQKISCEPEVSHRRLLAGDRYLILGCDGIWEKASSQVVADFLTPRLVTASPSKTKGKKQSLLTDACGAFLRGNLAKSPMADQGLGCDNMTLMAVDLRGIGSGKGLPGLTTQRKLASARGPARLRSSSLLASRRRSPAHRRRMVLANWRKD